MDVVVSRDKLLQLQKIIEENSALLQKLLQKVELKASYAEILRDLQNPKKVSSITQPITKTKNKFTFGGKLCYVCEASLENGKCSTCLKTPEDCTCRARNKDQ